MYLEHAGKCLEDIKIDVFFHLFIFSFYACEVENYDHCPRVEGINFSPNNVCVVFFGATKFITTHCQFDGINHWLGVINGDEVSKSRSISPFIAETISKHP